MPEPGEWEDTDPQAQFFVKATELVDIYLHQAKRAEEEEIARAQANKEAPPYQQIGSADAKAMNEEWEAKASQERIRQIALDLFKIRITGFPPMGNPEEVAKVAVDCIQYAGIFETVFAGGANAARLGVELARGVAAGPSMEETDAASGTAPKAAEATLEDFEVPDFEAAEKIDPKPFLGRLREVFDERGAGAFIHFSDVAAIFREVYKVPDSGDFSLDDAAVNRRIRGMMGVHDMKPLRYASGGGLRGYTFVEMDGDNAPSDAPAVDTLDAEAFLEHVQKFGDDIDVSVEGAANFFRRAYHLPSLSNESATALIEKMIAAGELPGFTLGERNGAPIFHYERPAEDIEE